MYCLYNIIKNSCIKYGKIQETKIILQRTKDGDEIKRLEYNIDRYIFRLVNAVNGKIVE